MRPEDPNFPEEIPPIPEPSPIEADQAAEVANTSGPGQSPTSPDSQAVTGPPCEEGRLSAQAEEAPWNEDEDFEWTEATPSARRDSSASEASRVAEIPAGDSPGNDDWSQENVPYQPQELGPIDQLLLLLADGVTQWKRLLRWVRSLLPPKLKRQLPDQVLTAILLGGLVLTLALLNPTDRDRASSTAVTPSPPAAPTAVEPSPAVDQPGSASNQLPSPEQTLIADVQTQVASISQAYGNSLIQSIDVNLPRNTLVLNVSESWYGLVPSQQDTLAQDIYNRVQSLQFNIVQILAPDGLLLAREPVVGSHMIILHRSRPAEELLASP